VKLVAAIQGALARMSPAAREWATENPSAANARWAIRSGLGERIVTLNMGLGRDSLTLLCLLVEGRLVAEGRPVAPREVDAVVFSDPGAEWSHTYKMIPRVRAFCDAHGLPFAVLAKPPDGESADYLANLPPVGDADRRRALSERPWRDSDRAPADRASTGYYHLRPGIIDDYVSRATIASRDKKDCTMNHKVEPIRKFIEDLSLARFGVDNAGWGGDVRHGRRRPHLTLIGIAADETDRIFHSHPSEGGEGPWYVTEAYPLVELGIKKSDEEPILARHGFDDARKSGCFMCPYQPIGWYWALRETEPALWQRVVAYEATALKKNPRMFLVGDTPVATAVERWRARNPAATISEVIAKSYDRCKRPKEVSEALWRARPCSSRDASRGAGDLVERLARPDDVPMPVARLLRVIAPEVGDHHRDYYLLFDHDGQAFQVKLEGWGGACVEASTCTPAAMRKARAGARALARTWRRNWPEAGVVEHGDADVWLSTWALNGPLSETGVARALNDCGEDDVVDLRVSKAVP